jgi:hypothetical protein
MAAAAAEGVKLVQNSDQVGINCPEFGRSMTPPKIEQPKMRTSIFAHVCVKNEKIIIIKLFEKLIVPRILRNS